MKRRQLLVSAATLSAAGLFGPTASAATAVPRSARGGSNYNFYHLDGCNREPYGVLKNFHTVTDTVGTQLADMHRGGQRRLIIGIFHHRGSETGTVMDSTGGTIAPQYRTNLSDLLAAIKQAGYAEVEVAFHTLAPNSPNDWERWHEDLYLENWQLIQHLRPVIANSGMHYRVNLGNELTPAPSQPFTLQYTQRLWADYTAKYGRKDTVGFSVIGSRAGRIAQIPKMYGKNPPHVFDFHFYGDERANEHEQFTAAHRQMTEMGYTQGWIVGETYYDDPAAAANIRRAIDETGREVYYLTQWPLHRDRRCDHVTVAPPTHFGNYIGHGF